MHQGIMDINVGPLKQWNLAHQSSAVVLVVMIIAFSLDNEMTMGLNFSKIKFWLYFIVQINWSSYLWTRVMHVDSGNVIIALIF